MGAVISFISLIICIWVVFCIVRWVYEKFVIFLLRAVLRRKSIHVIYL